jgi:hypothetical protein
MIYLSISHLTPPQLYERVGKRTHEPRSNFNHKKHLSTHLHTLLFLASFYSENTKTYFVSCIHNQNPEKHLPHL